MVALLLCCGACQTTVDVSTDALGGPQQRRTFEPQSFQTRHTKRVDAHGNLVLQNLPVCPEHSRTVRCRGTDSFPVRLESHKVDLVIHYDNLGNAGCYAHPTKAGRYDWLGSFVWQGDQYYYGLDADGSLTVTKIGRQGPYASEDYKDEGVVSS